MRIFTSGSAIRRIRTIIVAVVFVVATGGGMYYVLAVKNGIQQYYERKLQAVEAELQEYKERFQVALEEGDSLRDMEYECIELPLIIEEGNIVDVRILYPDGTDYVVLSKKQLYDIDAVRGLVHLHVDDQELLRMDCAVVDLVNYPGTGLYMTRYITPGVQKASRVDFIPRTVRSREVSLGLQN